MTSIHGLAVTPWSVIENGERKRETRGFVVRFTFKGATGPPGLHSSGHPHTETFNESMKLALEFVKANGWWPPNGSLSWGPERQPPGILPELDGPSMGLTLALGLARASVGLASAATDRTPPIDRCDLCSVITSAELGQGDAKRPQLVCVDEMPAKWKAILDCAADLGITTLVVSADQTDLPREPTLRDGTVVGTEWTHHYPHPSTGADCTLLVIRAVDVGDAISSLARAQTRNLALL